MVAYLVGNELSEASIRNTNANHPGINQYTGTYIQTGVGISATEAFIAEMADFVMEYEYDNYGTLSLVSYGNDIRTVDWVDTPFLDFISHNAYSYAVPYYQPNTSPGSSTGTLYQGWVEEVKLRHPNIPLLITETGLSVSPNAPHIGPPHYGYGGNTEAEQAEGLAQNLKDIDLALLPQAGACIHEYLDAWWKFDQQGSYTQDPNDIEEWFGITRFVPADQGYATEPRPLYNRLQETWQ